MKKIIILIIAIMMIAVSIIAQSYILYEGFEDEEFPPAGWSVRGWGHSSMLSDSVNAHSGQGFALSGSYLAVVDYYTLFTPALCLPVDNEINLKYFINTPLDSNQDYPDMGTSYSVLLSFSETDYPYHGYQDPDMVFLTTESITFNENWHERNIDLSQYAGQIVYIGFLMYQYGGPYIQLDDVSISIGDEISPPPIVITEFPYTDNFGQGGDGWQNHGGWYFSYQDNWAEAYTSTGFLITPQLLLPIVEGDEAMYLNFWTGHKYQYDIATLLEVYISTTGYTPIDFNTCLGTFPLFYGFRHDSISLDEYEGQPIYLAFKIISDSDTHVHSLLSNIWIGQSAHPGVMIDDDSPEYELPVMYAYIDDSGNWQLNLEYSALSGTSSGYELRYSFDGETFITELQDNISYENGWENRNLSISGTTTHGNQLKTKIVLVKIEGDVFWVKTTKSRWMTSPTYDDVIIPPQTKTRLHSNYPNPFNPSTTIQFSLNSQLSTQNPVNINIYNVKGQKVKSLVNGTYPSGTHSVIWDGQDDSGRSVSSGIYLYRMTTPEYTATRRMLLMK